MYETEEEKMKDLSNTQFFHVETGPQIKAKDILEIVYGALKEKGYNIARRTIAKYREQLNIPVARLRKEL